MKPSKIRRRLAQQAACEAVVKNNGAEYLPEFNPYADGFERERFERLYRNERIGYLNFVIVYNDMAEVYGAEPINL